MRTALTVVLTLGVAALIGGCTPPSESDTAAEKTEVKGSGSMVDSKVGEAGKGKVVNDPSSVQPGQSVRIVPANPDDPHFKTDPRLGGGH